MLIVTFGCEVWNAAATLCQTPSRGWVLPLFHQVRVTLALLDELALVLDVLLLLLLLLLLHAAIVSAAATAVATMTGFDEPRMRSHLLTMPRNSWCRVCCWPGLLALPKAADVVRCDVPLCRSESLGNFSEVSLS
jgi:hypothetical protein